ncbi:MAG: aminoglycoside phosphotransferase family protein [Parachlamydiales bacterium]|nr:aminoglycoside phosphotransferase family protein [Parachlamydiales bacterium]
MIEKQLLSDQRIIDCLNTDYGIEIAALSYLPLGADMNASMYRAQTLDGTSYFVKLKRGHQHDVCVTLLALLQMAGIQHIIPPVKTIHGKPILHIKDYTLIVYPFVEGRDAFSYTLTNDQWIALGKVLRQVHEFEPPPSVYGQIRRETYSPKWQETVRSLYSHLRTKQSGDEMTLKLIAFMNEHDAEIHRLVDRAEGLREVIRHQSPKFVLCHSDIHGGNVLVDRNGVIYIVDWDEPIMAPKERDLMFIGGGVANVWNNPHEENFFYKGYGKTEINRTILAYYRHERIVEDIAHYGQCLLLTTSGGADRKIIYKHLKDMFEPLGVVDIAFKTDESLNT